MKHSASRKWCLIVSEELNSAKLNLKSYSLEEDKIEKNHKKEMSQSEEREFFEEVAYSYYKKQHPWKSKKEESKKGAEKAKKIRIEFEPHFILTGYCYEKEMKKIEYKLLKEKYKTKHIEDEALKERDLILDYVYDLKSGGGHFTQTIGQYEGFMLTHGGYATRKEFEQKVKINEVSESIFSVR